MNLPAELEVVARLAREAGAIVRRVAREGFDRISKTDGTPVTEADLQADVHICNGLAAAFVGDGILSEERDPIGIDRHRVWVVDPLDGTKAFVRQVPGYSVMIGLLEGGEPKLGAVYDPVAGRLAFALCGFGAWVADDGGEPVRVRAPSGGPGQPVRLITTPSMPAALRERVLAETGLSPGPVVNSVGVKVALLVMGEGDAYLSHHGLSYWDTVAPHAIAREAGARFTGLDGRELFYDFRVDPTRWRYERPVFVSALRDHDEVAARVGAALAGG
jgi:3'(2'),5'-bisphosphate nucleotidase